MCGESYIFYRFFRVKEAPHLRYENFLLGCGHEIQIGEDSDSNFLPEVNHPACSFLHSFQQVLRQYAIIEQDSFIPLQHSNLLYNLALTNLVSGRALLNNTFMGHLVSVVSIINQIFTKSRNCYSLFRMKNLWDFFDIFLVDSFFPLRFHKEIM